MTETAYLREQLDFLQAQIELFAPFISKTFIRKHISLWRLCITTQKKHYPKAPQLFTEMKRFDLKEIASMILTLPPSHMDLQITIQRVKNLLEFPQTIHDNWHDSHPPLDGKGNPMMNIHQYWDYTLREKQANKTSHTEYSDAQVEMDPIDGKRFKNAHKKYTKEWKKEWL